MSESSDICTARSKGRGLNSLACDCRQWCRLFDMTARRAVKPLFSKAILSMCVLSELSSFEESSLLLDRSEWLASSRELSRLQPVSLHGPEPEKLQHAAARTSPALVEEGWAEGW